MNAWNQQNYRQQALKENLVLKDALGRKEKENQRLLSTYEQKIRRTEDWEDYTVNTRHQEVQNENQRLRGQLYSIVSDQTA